MIYTELLEKQILDRLQIDNPWWKAGHIPDFFAKMTPRLYLDIFMSLVEATDLSRAVILMGPRRVGKTVMMFHAIQRLISQGVPARNIIYISVETPIYNKILLETLLNLSCKVLETDIRNDQFFVFFDEIQYLKDWEVNLKSLVDTYRNVKFVASGSAAAELKKRSNESGAGRFTDFNLPPLTFYEYIHLKGRSDIMRPGYIDWHDRQTLVYETDKLTVLNNRRTDDTARNYQRETQFKIYLTNPSLRCALFQPIDANDEKMGDMVETAVFAQWIPRQNLSISYANWRTGRSEQGEVDIVGVNVAKQKPEWAVEIKWTDRFFDRPNELDSLRTFLEKNKMDSAIVTSISKQGRIETTWGILQFLPVSCYAYTVGANTVKQARDSVGL